MSGLAKTEGLFSQVSAETSSTNVLNIWQTLQDLYTGIRVIFPLQFGRSRGRLLKHPSTEGGPMRYSILVAIFCFTAAQTVNASYTDVKSFLKQIVATYPQNATEFDLGASD